MPPPSPGLYIHVPFCRSKCSYCDFVSGACGREIRAAYLAALEAELATRCSTLSEPFRTVYIGGGSPSSLADDEWALLIEIARARLAPADVVELTIEMNPSQVTPEKLDAAAGFATRLSLGAQTFDPALRAVLGRTPLDPDAIDRSAELIRGRFHLNLDLIHSIPGETMAALENDLARARALAPEHVSAYALSLEPGTPLFDRVASGELSPPSEEFQADALALARRRLAEGGLRQYEISNFAAPGRECLHNLAAWAGCEYLGAGASACSHLRGERTRNEDDVARYIERIRTAGDATVEREELDPARRAGELAMLNLRTRDGIDCAEFRSRTGFDPLFLFRKAIDEHERAGLLERTGTHVRLTEAGLDLANRVMADFVQ